MARFLDGTDEPLTYGQALVLMAGQYTGQGADEVLLAVQQEHDLVPPEPDSYGGVPVVDETPNQARLRKLREEKRRRDEEREIAELEAELGGGDQSKSDNSTADRPSLVDKAPGQV